MSKIGLFGGTFDPIHFGHLTAAQSALELLKLDRVLFIPAGRPPHKCGRMISPGPLRYKMVEMAISSNERFSISDLELGSDCSSYTVDTISRYKQSYISSEIYLLLGLDQALAFSTWKEIERIFDLCKVAVLIRPGYRSDQIEKKWLDRIQLLSIPQADISSSDIRERVARGMKIDHMVPENVINFIEKHKLYQGV